MLTNRLNERFANMCYTTSIHTLVANEVMAALTFDTYPHTVVK